MSVRTQPNRTVERLEANRQYLQHLADACGEEAGLHKPLAETVGGVVRSIPEDIDLAQALSDRATSDTLVHLLDQNREQVEHALQRVREGAYGLCESCGRRSPKSGSNTSRPPHAASSASPSGIERTGEPPKFRLFSGGAIERRRPPLIRQRP
jgi:RNA polymerase-binding transcription factor DksA